MNLMPSILHAAWLPSEQPTIGGELFLWARSLDFAAQPQSNNGITAVTSADERQRAPSHPQQIPLSQLRQQLAHQFPTLSVDKMRPASATAWLPTSNGVPESRRSVFQQASASSTLEETDFIEQALENVREEESVLEEQASLISQAGDLADDGDLAADPTALAEWQITGVAISEIDALSFLSQLSNSVLLNANQNDEVKHDEAKSHEDESRNGVESPLLLNRLRIGNDLLFLSSVSKFALEILAGQHYLPSIRSTIQGGFLAVWQPALLDASMHQRFETLLNEMPPVCRAYNLDSPATAKSAATITETMIASLVDGAIRSWSTPGVGGQNGHTHSTAQVAEDAPDVMQEKPAHHWFTRLLANENRLNLPPQPLHRLHREWHAWMDQLHIASDAGFRICFMLTDPDELDAGTKKGSKTRQSTKAVAPRTHWQLSYHLQSRNNPQILIAAAEIWTASTASLTIEDMRIDQPQERFLAGLGAVSHLFEPIAKSLAEPRPEFAELSIHEAYQFMCEVGPLLSSSGFGVILPAWWSAREERQLGLRLRLTSAPDLGIDELPGLHTEVDYSWDLTLGDEIIDHEAFKRLVELDSPLVRIHNRWTELNPEQISAAQRFLQGKTPPQQSILPRIGSQKAESSTNFGKMTLLQALRMIAQKGSDLPAGEQVSGLTGANTEPSSGPESIQANGSEQSAKNDPKIAEKYALNMLIETPALLPLMGVDLDGWLSQAIERLQHSEQMPEVVEPAGFEGELRPYQRRGVAWLGYLRRLGIGACLADDMGLGKTIQAIALHLYIKEQLKKKKRTRKQAKEQSAVYPTLLICPTSVLANWQREINRFAPALRTIVHHGNNRLTGEEFLQIAADQDFVITSYGTARRDIDSLRIPLWQDVILDEAQNIKNPNAKQTQAVRLLRSQHRIALTGTPIENRLSELWSIFEFLNPGYLGGHDRFHKEYILPIERYNRERHIDRLRQTVQPFLLRRLKTDPAIISDLPEKNEMIVYCSLTREQQQLYTKVVENTLAKLEDSEGVQRRGLILGLITKLKQVANHPAHYLKQPAASLTNEAINNRSGKLSRLSEMLEEALSVGDHALIFTQFVEMGSLLQAYLSNILDESIPFLHGGTTAIQRDRMVQKFQSEDGPPVFILSLRAGGSGLNLTRANHVFHYDRWWNPAIENQATDRAFRIGQERNVQVHKFVAAGTLEEHIHSLIENKKALAENIVGSGEDWLTEMDNSQLRELLMLRSDLQQK